MRALTPSRLLLRTALIVGCLALASCSTPKGVPRQTEADMVRSPNFWQPQLLYLLASPHPQLYVEVDAVEGSVPSDAWLNKLRDFLAAYCQKPGGIQIVRSDVIPANAALGISPTALARQFLNGPPTNGAAPAPAFLYVLCYNDLLSSRIGTGQTRRAGVRNPHVDDLPYPAMIYMDTRIGFNSVHDLILLHETGHVLGLAFRPANAFAGHCLDPTCLMYKTLAWNLPRYLTGQDPVTQRKLCDRCVAQLAAGARETPPSNLRFVGPVLVRSEVGYHVLSLPHRVKIILGELAEQDCRDFAAAVRAETPSRSDPDAEQSEYGLAKEEVRGEPAKLCAVLDRAKADPYDVVRSLASNWWVRVSTQRYLASRQFSNAVAICRQAILANPQDDWSYNQLARIKATCSEPTIRDGKEAVAAARKACALTKWKEWSCIDTLAAAYAEAGDFKRAVAFEEQALRSGPPAESDQAQIRERIALYKQSRPFRDKP